MNQRDRLPTPADYMAGAVCPLLIMLMVGSLVFFVQDLVYQGPHALRLRWMLFWYVIGMVGVSRLAIEKTSIYAGLYGLLLGLAVALFISRFFEFPIVGWLLLAVIWWSTNKLTWDCTLLDERQDASGEGLLEITGLDETAPDSKSGTSQDGNRSHSKWWQNWILNPSQSEGQPHAPGKWVLYFALAALPVFGLGQLELNRGGQSGGAFGFASVYLVSSIGLLLLTSFLGLRRYLRQRRMKMPGAIAASWIGLGVAMLLGVLIVSVLLPRPVSVASPGWFPSLQGRSFEEQATLHDEQAEETDDRLQRQDESGSAEEEASREEGQGERSGQESQPDAAETRSGNGSGEGRSSNVVSGSPQSALTLPDWLRWLVWGVFGLVLLYFLLRHWREVMQALKELLESLKQLFGPKRRKHRKAGPSAFPDESPVALRKPFHEYPNPFLQPHRPDPRETVRMTYEALEAWAEERGARRSPDMTAMEFVRNLSQVYPGLRALVRTLASLHAGCVYADQQPEAEQVQPLEKLWTEMERQ